MFINATSSKEYVQVSSAIAILFLIARFIMLLFAVSIHVINIVYRTHSSIKATSPKLNHLIFIGFYSIVVYMTLYTVVEAWPHSVSNHNIMMLSSMCRALPWFLSIGSTLVFGTVFVKTYRLYYIYSVAKRGIFDSSKRMADPALFGYVGTFVSVDALLCLLWAFIDPLIHIRE